MTPSFSLSLSVFENTRIEPTPQAITALMPKFNQLQKFVYLPNTTKVQNLDLLTGVVKELTNLSFQSTDGKSRITCADDRIDCAVPFTSDNPEEMLRFCVSILSVLMDEYNITGNRLAVNIDLYRDSDVERFEPGEYAELFTLYQQNKLAEWSSTANAQFDITVSGKAETVNFITLLKNVIVSANQPAVLCHLDVNTVPYSKENRFSKASLISFTEAVLPFIKQTLDQFLGDAR